MIRPLKGTGNILLYQSCTFGFEFCLIHILLLLSGGTVVNENDYEVPFIINNCALSRGNIFVLSFPCKPVLYRAVFRMRLKLTLEVGQGLKFFRRGFLIRIQLNFQ